MNNYIQNTENYLASTLDTGKYVSVEEEQLLSKREQKIAAAEAKKAELIRKDYANLDPSTYTQLENGSMEPNKNKLWNDISDQDIQGIFGLINAKYQTATKEDGSTVIRDVMNSTETPYDGKTRKIYFGPSKTDPNVMKLGISVGGITSEDLVGTKWEGKDPSIVRYDPEAAKHVGLKKYGWESGPEGIDPNKMQSIEVPWAVGTTFEALLHGRKNSLANRAEPIYGEKGKERFGSGQSEYYKDGMKGMMGDYLRADKAPLDYSNVENKFNQYLGVVQQSNLRQGVANKALYDQYEGLTPAQYQYLKETLPKEQYERMGITDKVLNAGKAAVYGVTKSGMDVVDAVAEGVAKLAGAGVGMFNPELGKKIDAWEGVYAEGEADKKAKDLSGYSSYNADKRLEQAMTDYQKATRDVSLWDSSTWKNINWDKVGSAVLEVVQAPELIPLSLGYMAAPGAIGKLAGAAGKGLLSEKGLKAAEEANNLRVVAREATDADKKWAANQRLAEKIKEIPLSDRTKTWLMTSGVTAGTLGGAMNNEQLDAYIKENGGEEATIGRALGGWLANSLAATLDYAALSKITTGGVSNIADVMKATDKGTALKLLQGAGIATLEAAKGGLIEAPQEFIQSYVEAYNKVYGTIDKDAEGNVIYEPNGEPKRVGAFEALEQSRDEAVVGAMAGLSMGAVMGAGKVGVEAAGAKLSNTSTAPVEAKQPSAVVKEATTVAVNENQVKKYATTLLDLRSAVQENKITADTISEYIDKVESLYDIRTGIEGFDAEQLKKADDTYKVIASKFNEIILSNPDLKLNKIVTPQVLGSAPDLDAELAGVTASVDTKGSDPLLAERVLAIALDAADNKTVKANGVKYVKFAINNGIDRKDAIDMVKNFASVEEEATIGDRGYLTYLARAKSLMASDKPDQVQIDTVYDKLIKFKASTEKSLSALQATVEGAKQEAAKLTKAGAPDFGKSSRRFKGSYIKSDGRPFDVDIVRDKKTGVWSVAENAALTSILEAKTRTIKGIDRALGTLGSKRTGVPLNVGQLIVPSNAIKSSVAKSQENDSNHVNNALSKLSAIVGESRINKVIVDESTASKKWKVGGDYFNANSPITNTGEYSSTDVVYVHGAREAGSKGISNWKSGGNEVKGKPKLEAHPAAAELLSAVQAGATIVLDRSFRNSKTVTSKGKTYKAGTLSAEGKDLVQYLTNKGYVLVPGTVDTLVMASDETKAKIEALHTEEKAKQEVAKARKLDMKNLTDLAAVLKAQAEGVIALSAEKLDEVTKEYEELKAKVVNEQFTKISKEELLEDLQDNSNLLDLGEDGELVPSSNLDDAKVATVLDQKATPEENLLKHLENKINMLVKGKVLQYGTSEVVDDADPELLNIGDKVARDDKGRLTNVGKGSASHILALMAKEKAMSVMANDGAVETLLTKWQEILDKKLDERTTNAMVEELIANSGIDKLTDAGGALLALEKDLLEMSASKGQGLKYITTSEKGETKVLDHIPTDEEITKFGIVSVVEVNPDITSYVQSSGRTTLLNTLVVSALPFKIKEQVTEFHNKSKGVVAPLSKDRIENGVVRNREHYLLSDSPARGLLFNSKGTISPQVTAAMWLALMETLKSDKFKLTLGVKSRADVANMLNIPEHQVTKEQLKFAKEHGMLNKSLANTLGKAVLAELGLSKKTSDVNKGHYELLASDLGNMAIATAESMGWLEYKLPTTAQVGAFFGKDISADGTKGSTKTVRYVHIKPSNLNKDKDLVSELGKTYNVFAENESLLPAVNTARKDYFANLTEAQIDKNKSSVRNDVTGGVHAVPEEAQKTLDNLMRTKYTMDVKAAKNFLSLVDAKGSKVKELLGYIEVSENNPEYVKLSFEAKDIQVSINRDIEKSIEELRRAVDKKDDNFEVQYLFYYTRNGRYMLDSNTINPQTDKIHRFLMQPSAHTLTYALEGAGRDTKFLIDGKDYTYGVSVALVQAFGGDIDKTSTADIVEMGRKLLGLTASQLQEVKTAIVTTGKFEGHDLKLKAAHFTHTLQGIDFLEQVHTGSVTSALTAEFDSVTNGFMNKLMQLPIIKNMKEHLARVGILSKEFLSEYPEVAKLLDLENGEAVNTILSSAGAKAGFLDSYKNLASTVAKGLDKSTDKYFLQFKDFLPRPDEDGGISSELRNLFKPPFMTFNYSASIKSIRSNLSEDLVKGLLDKVAKGDDEGRQVAKIFLDNGVTVSDDTKNTKKYSSKNKAELEANIDKFIEAVRTRPLTSITVQGKNIADFYSSRFSDVYGALVEEAFTSNFGEFLDLQNHINDMFKITYRLFEEELNSGLRELERANKKVTETQYKQLIKDLWVKFPAIEGPMTQAIDGTSYDVIPVTDSGTTSNETGAALRDTAQTKLINTDKNAKSAVKSITVHAVMRFLKEASKAGSVLPFHYIDGAELGRTINTLSDKFGATSGFTPIHDAMMVPVTLFSDATFTYNKELVDTNRNYSLLDSLIKTTQSWNFKEGVKYSSDGLNVAKGKPLDLKLAGVKVIEGLKSAKEVADGNREALFKDGNGIVYNNMIGAANGYYKIGMTSPAVFNNNGKSVEEIEVGNEPVESTFTGKVVNGIINTIDNLENLGC